MSHQPRNFQPGFSYHVTTRCNNREFNLAQRECREVFLYAIKKALDKHGFKLYALCILSNYVHYLIEPVAHQDLPKIMHFLNWYTAMCFNRIRTYAKVHDVGAIHELPLPENKGFGYCLRKS